MGRDDGKLEHALSIRVSAADVGRLDAITVRIPVATRHAIARAALRIGLAALERDPALIVEQPLARRGGARPRAKRSGR